MAVRILAFAGSLRAESWNKKVLKLAVGGARAAGAEVTEVDLKDFALPVYDGDLEAKSGLPEGAVRLKELFLAHGGLLIASPENNSSVSAALKNALDWVSRSAPGEAPLACFAKKVAGLVAASPGAFGGVRGLLQLRAILGSIKTLVIPEQATIGSAAQAFEADGRLKDAKQQAAVENVGRELARVVGKLYA